MKIKENKISMMSILFAVSYILVFFSFEGSYTIQSILPVIVIGMIYLIYHNNGKFKLNTCNKIVLFLGMIYIVSTIINMFLYGVEIKVLIQLFYQFAVYLWFFEMTYDTFSSKEIIFVKNVYIYVCFFASIYLLYCNVIQGKTIFAIKNLSGIQLNKNYFAAFLCSAPILTLHNVFEQKGKFKNIFFMIIIALAIFFTNSRGALLAMGIGIACEFGMNFFNKFSIKKMFILCCSLIVIGIALSISVKLLPAWMYNRYFVNSYEDDSNKDRVSRWENAIDGVKESPLIGFGAGIFSTIPAHQYTNLGYKISPSTPAHNTYLDILIDIGVIGFSTFVFLMYSIFKYTFNKNKSMIPVVICLMITTGILGANRAVYFWNTLIFIYQMNKIEMNNREEIRK